MTPSPLWTHLHSADIGSLILSLTAKRTIGCTNKQTRDLIRTHFARTRLKVRKEDATFENAQFVANRLPHLEVLCVEGETGLPRGELEVKRLRGVERIKVGGLRFETALFLGSVLAGGSEYFRGLLLGGGSYMAGGGASSPTLTLEEMSASTVRLSSQPDPSLTFARASPPTSPSSGTSRARVAVHGPVRRRAHGAARPTRSRRAAASAARAPQPRMAATDDACAQRPPPSPPSTPASAPASAASASAFGSVNSLRVQGKKNIAAACAGAACAGLSEARGGSEFAGWNSNIHI